MITLIAIGMNLYDYLLFDFFLNILFFSTLSLKKSLFLKRKLQEEAFKFIDRNLIVQ